jgi:hypothetical protein
LGTKCSLQICIANPCGGIQPLTVGHGDNVFLNGLAQQALQKEIARLKILPENLCSYQNGKGCGDATIVDSVVKEAALQTNTFYLAEIDDDAKKMCLIGYILNSKLLYLCLQVLGFTDSRNGNVPICQPYK